MTCSPGYGRALAMRTVAAAFLWWTLSEGRADSWAVGVVAVLLAVAASLGLLPLRAQPRVRLAAAIAFAGYFLVQSLRAGLQVAWLALAPHARIAPGSIELTLALPPGPARYLLAGTLRLLPGTLSVRLDAARLVVHALTGLAQVETEVRALETRIAALFGVPR